MTEPDTGLSGLPAPVVARLTGQTDLASTSNQLAIYRTELAYLRTHLANERTHLAYLRTAISLVGFGITINRFAIYLMQEKMAPTREVMLRDTGNAGWGMVVIGLILLGWSLYRYWAVNRDIDEGRYSKRFRVVLWTTLILLLAGGASVIWLFPQH
ncbi:MAG TPA: DUF202 domain-containing protein [Stenotrophomonas sp.]|jgi:putative membrane protein